MGSMKYKTIEEFLAGVVQEDAERKAAFERIFKELINSINQLESSDTKDNYPDQIAGQELTNQMNELIASIPTETLFRWFPKVSMTKEVK